MVKGGVKKAKDEAVEPRTDDSKIGNDVDAKPKAMKLQI
jgi:hypothetical protein